MCSCTFGMRGTAQSVRISYLCRLNSRQLHNEDCSATSVNSFVCACVCVRDAGVDDEDAFWSLVRVALVLACLAHRVSRQYHSWKALTAMYSQETSAMRDGV